MLHENENYLEKHYTFPVFSEEVADMPFGKRSNILVPISEFERCLDCLARTSIKRIIQNGPATIVFWEDDTKTVVKRSKNDPESDVYSVVAYALAKKRYRSNPWFKKLVDDHLEVKNRND